jgi:acetoin utilization deacetylase AcuC-like enzyme/GNAT superfamily N-acetyltransferase
MFRIRRIYDITTPYNRSALEQVFEILEAQFPGLDRSEIEGIEDQLVDPMKHRFRAVIFVAEDARDRVRGFSLLLHAPDLDFCYLQYISAAPGRTGGGIGGILYERAREEARDLGAIGIFLECLPDDPALCPDPEVRRQNEARLKFYERYGARPVAGTAYETPFTPGDKNPPYLVFDNLGMDQPLPRDQGRKIVRAILERKYGDQCPPGYVDMVVESFGDDPVELRPPRYHKPAKGKKARFRFIRRRRIALIKNDKHELHHVRERGYVESPVRIVSIMKAIEPLRIFEEVKAVRYPEDRIREIHDPRYVEYLKKACALVPPGRSIYPYVFPLRNVARPPTELPLRAGYYCIDTFTPLNGSALAAALDAVDCALTGANLIQEGYRCAYALVRPPGHHAERRVFGGFCYFNSAAIAANLLSRSGRVAVLDVDYHHGNGTQDIFYGRGDVLTVSLHGPPRLTYPYFSGFADERGEGQGSGANRNFHLPEGSDGRQYRELLEKAIGVVKRFRPRFLVVALGLDTAKGDPTGSFILTEKDFRLNGRLIGSLALPTLVVQEGGYRTRTLGDNTAGFFTGLGEELGIK